jgi:hypothetical protein
VEAIRHVLQKISLGEFVVETRTVDGLSVALDLVLDAYADVAGNAAGKSA